MREKLIAKLQAIQKALAERSVGVNKLERLSAEAKRAFDSAIDSLWSREDIIKEIEARREQLKKWRRGFFRTVFPINWRYVFSMPFIYGMIIPALFFHIGLEIYHQVCFRIYRIPRVKSQEYFIYDRQLLPYLNWFEKFNCVYCSYVNNLIRYAAEIGGRTERYWCPIKYARRMEKPHSQYPKFVDYLDAENFRKKWSELRDFSDITNPVSGPVPSRRSGLREAGRE
ncbi:MAG: hypothetical protein WC745_01385 [Patescibacteria group bacterium]|jgi:hypothetical protein